MLKNLNKPKYSEERGEVTLFKDERGNKLLLRKNKNYIVYGVNAKGRIVSKRYLDILYNRFRRSK